MRFITLLVFSVFLLPFHLLSQYDDLLRNPDITWLAEYTADYELNPVYNDNLDEEYNLLNVVRLENTGNVNGLYTDAEVSNWMSIFILDGLTKDAFDCYVDEQLRQAVPSGQLQRLLSRPDTTPSFDHPGETIVSINEVGAEDIVLFRARQALFYDASKRVLGARLLAIAPLLAENDSEGNTIGYQPLVWIKMPVLNKKNAKRLHKEASYIVQTRMKENAPGMEQAKRVKGQFDLQRWTYGEVARPTHQNLSNESFIPLTAPELQALVWTKDTIISFNEKGKTQIDRIVENDATRRVEKIRFVQNWYIDERRRVFDCRVVAIAPLAAVRDSEGNFRYYKPLFYVRY